MPLRPLLAYVVAGLLLAAGWSRVEVGGAPLGEVLLVLAIGAVPLVLIVLGAHRLVVAVALAVGAVVAAGVAFGVSPLDARPGDRDFFGPVVSEARYGVQSFWESSLPFDPADYPAMEGLVVFAIFAFAAGVGVLAALGRMLAAALVLLVGVGWAATIVPGEEPLLSGALALGALLLFLALARLDLRGWRAVAPAVVVGTLLAAAAVGASTSQAVSKGAFLAWQSWDFYEPAEAPVSVGYVWTSQYGGLTWPEERTTVLKVEQDGARRQLYWRATTLDEYNGSHWLETQAFGESQASQETVDVAAGDPLLPGAAYDPENWIEQEVTVEALRDTRLVGAAQPVRWQPGTSLGFRRGPGGTIHLEGPLRQGQQYRVWSYAPRPKPAELEEVGPDQPADLPDRYTQPLQNVDVPPFRSDGRDDYMRSMLRSTGDSFRSDHLEVYELATRLTDRARSPYAAALVLETWFRNPSAGGFVYDEQPGQAPAGIPPLIAFVDPSGDSPDGRRGYCQHFAGAMTLMLRLLGIPSRIAAGFTSGTYDTDDRAWLVADRNAHTWVEVYFEGYGWLPFDPTPGRGTLDAPYSFAFTSGATVGEKTPDLQDVLDRIGAAALTRTGLSPDQRSGREAAEAVHGARSGLGGPAVTALPEEGERPIDTSLIAFLALLAGGAAAAVILVKVVVRRVRFATREPRRVAAACRRDLVGFLRDQGADPAPSATVSELGELLEAEFALDPARYVDAVSAARFGPAAGARPAARSARRELGRLRREMWRQLSWGRRIRTALSLRSLTG